MTQLTHTTLAAAEAARLLSLGYRVLRMHGDTKQPAVRKGVFGKAHPTFSSQPEDFSHGGYGLAILCGPSTAWPEHDLVCLDLDGDTDFDLEGALGPLPPTLTSKAGRHRYYLAPRGALKNIADWFRTKASTGTGLDVKTDGGYAVEYPSLNGRGERVEYDPPGWRDPVELPAEALERLLAARAKQGSVKARAVGICTAAPPSVQGQNGSGALWQVALDLVRGLRLSVGEAHAAIMTHYSPRCEPPWSEAEVLHKCQDALDKGQVKMGWLLAQEPEGGYLLTEKGAVKACFENVVRYVKAMYPELRWDEVALVVYDGQKRVDLEAIHGVIRSGANVAVGLDPSKNTALDAVVHVARESSFNRIREALEALPRWDGRRRLDRWLVEALGAEDSEYHRAVGRAWLVSAVARAFVPGVKADHMLLLEGAQGIGKSTALDVLGGEGLYKDLTFSSHDKDSMQDLRGAWVVEYSELAGLSKRDDDWLKGHIARRVDTYRASYGIASQDHPRTCVLAGTVNPQGDGRYLRDSENRRYWPVACEALPATLPRRVAWLKGCRDQLWAEAVAAYRAGEVWHLDRDVGQAQQQEARREIDPLEDSVTTVVKDDYEVNMRELRLNPVLLRDLPSSAVGQAKALAKVLRKLGFKPPTNHVAPIWRRRRPEQS